MYEITPQLTIPGGTTQSQKRITASGGLVKLPSLAVPLG